MILGNTSHGVPTAMGIDEIYVRQVEVPESGLHVPAVNVLVDGLGPGSGSTSICAVLYTADGDLLTAGPALVVADGAPAAWRALPLDVAGARIDGEPWIGLRVFDADDSLRLYGLTGTGEPAETAAAVDGPPADLSGGVSSTIDGALFVDAFPRVPVPAVGEIELARLPWSMSQRAFGSTGAISDTRRTAMAGWHHVETDPERDAVCIVRTGGPLEDLVGERLLITYRIGTLTRSVAVFCHDEQDFPPEVEDEQISLPLEGFRRLAPLALDSVPVTVEVVA